MNKRLIILDRDGVINYDSDDYVKSADEWRPLPGSLEAIGRLTRGGYRIAVATNQAGIAKGLFDEQTLNAMHEKMMRLAAEHGGVIEAVFVCPHRAEDRCRCRKPEPGLFFRIASRFATDLRGVPAVGDSLRDIQAARAAGAWPLLVRTGKGRDTERAIHGTDVAVYDDLSAVVDHLLAGDT